MSDQGTFRPLVGLRVVEVSDGIAGGHCAKLFVDAGAEVLRLQGRSPTLRSWSWSGSAGRDGHPDGALFRHLHDGKEVRAGAGEAPEPAALLDACRSADLVVLERPVGRPLAEAVAAARRANPALSSLWISPLGTGGPDDADHPNEFLLQARVGSTFGHGLPGRVPLAVGGQLGSWAAGVYAAAAGLAACLQARRSGLGAELDLSVLECLALTLVTYPTVGLALPGGYRSRGVGMMLPAVEPCRDGYVGLFTVTAEQFGAFLHMIERPELADDPRMASYEGRAERMDELVAATHAWTRSHTVEEVIDRAVLFRVPAAPIGNGQTLPALAQTAARGVFGRSPATGLLRARPPLRWHLPPGARPAVGPLPRPPDEPRGVLDFLPLEGVRVFDLTAFWAGPFATMFLGSMGADVLKIESVQRPDPIRFNTRTSPSVPQWYEQGFLFHGANLDKSGVTLNLADPVGRELALRLLSHCDVLIENFTPRVLEQFGWSFETLRAARPGLICLRMPAFGLDGPWRDRPGFAPNVEQASGMAWVTGYPDGPPMVPGGACDPVAGMYAAFAVMGALLHRPRQGGAQMIELPMIEMGASLVAEQVLEWDSYGSLVVRQGNRHPGAAPQGVYPCRGGEQWVAVSVEHEAQWRSLAGLLAVDPGDGRFADHRSRAEHHDELDRLLDGWCGGRSVEQACAELGGAGVPCAEVRPHYEIDADPQMVARGFWQPLEHPVVGTVSFPGWPFTTPARRSPWHHRSAPLLGQDTERVLREVLDLGPEELAELERTAVTGSTPRGL
ncbi:MAG: CaiB/BaiF CoA-transferase family protein [Acidimicrobiales bacterium]